MLKLCKLLIVISALAISAHHLAFLNFLYHYTKHIYLLYLMIPGYACLPAIILGIPVDSYIVDKRLSPKELSTLCVWNFTT